MRLVQFHLPGKGKRMGVLEGESVIDITEGANSVLALLKRAIANKRSLESEGQDALKQALQRRKATLSWAALQNPPFPGKPHLLLPLDTPEVWGAGVTYKRSAEERDIDSQRDVYTRVYFSQRPELFFKATLTRCVPPWGEIGIRSDSQFTTTEPEVAVVIGADNRPVAFTLCNDVSAWDIERENPLYLPQSKVFRGCCSFGPILVTAEQMGDPYAIDLICRIVRDGKIIFEGSTSTAQMNRRFDELITFLRWDNPVPIGTVLTTGTGIITPPEAALEEGDLVEIESPKLGKLVNFVRRL